MNQTGGMKAIAHRCALVVLMFCLALLPTTTGHLASPHHQQPMFHFDQDQGITVTDTVSLSGSSSEPLRDASWEILDYEATDTPLNQGNYLTTVTPMGGGFQWNLSFDVSSYDCTCIVNILVPIPHSNNTHVHSFYLYIGSQSEHQPILHPPNFDYMEEIDASMNLTAADQEEISGVLDILSHDSLNALENANIQFEFLIPGGVSNFSVLKANICQAPFGICIEDAEIITLDSYIDNTTITASLNATMVNGQEGLWRFSFFFQDSLLRTSAEIPMIFIYDTTLPEVRINMDSNAGEREIFSVFSEGIDGYTGAEMTETWTLTLPNGSIRAPLDGEIVNSGHLVFNFSQSGVYSLELTMRDKAGNMNSTMMNFSVMNQVPRAIVTVDGLTTSFDQVVRMVGGSNWTVIGTESLDNEPIDYLWIIDDSTSIRGVESLSFDDFKSAGTYSVELIVFDDDGATNSTSITLIIDEEPDELASGPDKMVIGFVGLVLSVLISTLVYFWFGRKPTSALPKWSAKNQTKQSSEALENTNEDATIEEASAGG